MILTATPVKFLAPNGVGYVTSEGRMAWDVSPGTHQVIRNPPIMNFGVEDVQSVTWQCSCPQGLPACQIGPYVCDHIQASYLQWLNAENRKRQMQEEVERHARQTQQERIKQLAQQERRRIEQEAIEKINQEIQIPDFVPNPKRKINLEE